MSEKPNNMGSKIFVVLCVTMILGGVVSWNLWDHFGTTGINPKKAKKLASDYEIECYELTKEVKPCKKHIGARHTTCLPEGLDRTKPGEEPRPIRYDQEGYSACMRKFRDDDLAAWRSQADAKK